MANAHPVQVDEAAGNARSMGSALAAGAYSRIGCGLLRVAGLAQRLPVRLRPEQLLIATVIDDVVDHVGRCHATLGLAHHAEGMGFEELQAVALPLTTVASLCRGQSLTPRIRVQHLDRLRISYGCASGLHTDAGLSHDAYRCRSGMGHGYSAMRDAR